MYIYIYIYIQVVLQWLIIKLHNAIAIYYIKEKSLSGSYYVYVVYIIINYAGLGSDVVCSVTCESLWLNQRISNVFYWVKDFFWGNWGW